MDEFWYDISQLWVGTFFYGINTPVATTTYIYHPQAIINLVLGAADIDRHRYSVRPTRRCHNHYIRRQNIIADGLVIYRCYAVWNYNKYVVILPIIMLIVTSVFGVVCQFFPQSRSFFGLSLATNVVVTVFTASAPCSRAHLVDLRQSRAYLKTDEQRRYISVISILVESGDPIFQMLTQVLGIAPTLIIVRVGLGVHVQSFESTVGTAVAKSENARPHKRHILGIHFRKPHLDNALPSLPQDVEKGQPNYGSGKPWSF
ncbi:hypothetical protein B0H13DRAFT_1927130 [Mycena leptocephala]|nr:hypothetical protein B0H13DRAFT_1927130 [Mycena leptocephala]